MNCRTMVVIAAACAAAASFWISPVRAADAGGAGAAPRTHQGGAHKKSEQVLAWAVELQLTDDQVTKIQALYEDQKAQIAAAKADPTLSGDKKALAARTKEIQAATNDKINQILTADQQKKLADLKAQDAAKKAADKALKSLTTDLALTPDQQTKVLPILMDLEMKVAAVKADATIAKKDQRTQIDAFTADASTQIKAIVSADQAGKVDDAVTSLFARKHRTKA